MASGAGMACGPPAASRRAASESASSSVSLWCTSICGEYTCARVSHTLGNSTFATARWKVQMCISSLFERQLQSSCQPSTQGSHIQYMDLRSEPPAAP